MAVNTDLRGSVRISRDLWLHTGTIGVTTNGDGEASYDFEELVGDLISVVISSGRASDGSPIVGSYHMENKEIIVTNVDDGSDYADGTAELPFIAIGTKGRAT